MNKYIVGILSMFENNLELFKIVAENEYEAVKKAMVEFSKTPEGKKNQIEWQSSREYPSNLQSLREVYEDFPFNVIKISEF